jgi:hypothetical protein
MSVETNDYLAEEIPKAANIGRGSNPDYSYSDFIEDFPQFEQATNIPSSAIESFISIADSSLPYSKYGESWKLCMGLYTAHLCTMFANAAKSNGESAAPIASESVGDVSKSYDTNSIMSDFEGFGALKLTSYGQQLATFVKLAGMGGMFVW